MNRDFLRLVVQNFFPCFTNYFPFQFLPQHFYPTKWKIMCDATSYAFKFLSNNETRIMLKAISSYQQRQKLILPLPLLCGMLSFMLKLMTMSMST